MPNVREQFVPHLGPGQQAARGFTTRPSIRFINPNFGPITGGTLVTISGRYFAAGITITFGGVAATSVTIIDNQTLTCLTPPAAEGGLVDVVITLGGQSTTFARAFTYSATKVVTVTPQSGMVPGVVRVLLYGYNFVSGSTVTVGGVAATNVTFYDTQHLSFTTPSSSTSGFRDIVITDPFGAVTTVRNGFQYITLARYADIRRDPGIEIQDTLNNAPNTASLTIDGEGARPQSGESISIVDSFDGNRKLFAGTILTSVQDYDEDTSKMRWAVTATDFTWLFNRRRPFGTYVLVSASDIVRDLVQRYAPSFTVAHVQSNLARITVQFDGSKDLATAMSDIASAIGGGHWYVDYNQDVHFFHELPPEVLAVTQPPTVVQSGPGAAVGGGSAMTVAPIAGGAVNTQTDAGFFSFFASTFVYDDGVESALSPFTSPYYMSPTQQLFDTQFSNLPIGVAIGTHNVVARNIYRVIVGTDLGGQSAPLYQLSLYCKVNDNTTTTFRCKFNGSFASVATVQSADSLGADVPKLRQIPRAASPAYDSPDSAPTATEDLTTLLQSVQPEIALQTDSTSNVFFDGPGSLSMTPGYQFQFKIANLYADMTLSQLGPESNVLTLTTGINAVKLDGIPVGQPLNGVPVIARVVFGAWMNLGGQVTGWETPGAVQVWYLIPDNTNTSYDVSMCLPFSLGDGTVPTVGNDTVDVPVWPNDDGPSLEDTNPPDDINASNTTLIRDSQFQYETDLSQVRNRIFVTGAATALTADVPTGSDILAVADCSMFANQTGQLYVNGELHNFAGVSASSGPGTVFLVDALNYDAPNGTAVALFAMVEDLDSQRALGLLELDKDGQPTDGIHEYVVQDSSLRSPAELIIRGQAELELFANPIGTIRYSTRDPKTRSGATVHVDLTNPPCFGDFLIQQVTIDQIHDASDDLYPRYTVMASSVKYQLPDLLLSILKTGGQSVSAGSSSVSLAGLQEVVNQTFNSKSSAFDPTRKSVSWVQPLGGTTTPVQLGSAGVTGASGIGNSMLTNPTANDDPDATGLNAINKADNGFWGYLQLTTAANNTTGVKHGAGVFIENNIDYTFVLRTPYQALLSNMLIWCSFIQVNSVSIPTTVNIAGNFSMFGVRFNGGADGGWRAQFTKAIGITAHNYSSDVIAPVTELTTYYVRMTSSYSPLTPNGASMTFTISTMTKGNLAQIGQKTIKYTETQDPLAMSELCMPVLDNRSASSVPMTAFMGIVNKVNDGKVRWLKFGRIVGTWDAWENY